MLTAATGGVLNVGLNLHAIQFTIGLFLLRQGPPVWLTVSAFSLQSRALVVKSGSTTPSPRRSNQPIKRRK